MIQNEKNVEGQYFPTFHCGWGGCAEELFHYTSRYYVYTEAFLRNLTDNRSFCMSSYHAAHLSRAQRILLAAVLSCRPNKESAEAVIEIVTSVCLGKSFVSQSLIDRYHAKIARIPKRARLTYRRNIRCPSTDLPYPLDPFLNIAERLRMPVAVRQHHIEVSLYELAKHLDSPILSLRVNLQNAVLQVHKAGYLLRNHPGLTHSEAKAIADETAV